MWGGQLFIAKFTANFARRADLADALRIGATTLERSQSAMGAFYRRMKAKLGTAEGVTARAHKLARTVYRLLKYGEAYVRQGADEREKKYQARKLQTLRKTANCLALTSLNNRKLHKEFLKRDARSGPD